MRKHLVIILSFVLVVACMISSVLAYDYTGSFTKKYDNDKVKITGAMSLVSGSASTQGTKLKGSTYNTLYVSVSAYNTNGSRNYSNNSSPKIGDVTAKATAPGSGTPSYAVCAASYNTSSDSTAYNLCTYTVAAG